MDSKLAQDNFQGDPEVLEAFLQLAYTPIRSQKRTEALAAWRDFKLRKLVQLWPDVSRELFGGSTPVVVIPGGNQPTPRRGSPFTKGWNMVAMRRHLIDLTRANLDGICIGFVDLRGVKLDGASLRGAWLKGAELEWASLRNADLSGARLLRADLSNADLHGANLYSVDLSDSTCRDADLSGANLSHCDLTRANMVGSNLERANLNGSHIYGISAWNVQLTGAEQTDLVITQDHEPTVTVDNLEVAQFIYLLLTNEKIRNVIETLGKKAVLILGRFTAERKATLEAIRKWLREKGYVPIVFDFDKPIQRDLTETISILAHMSRFIIADLTEARSIPQELQAIVPDLPSVAVQPIILESDREYALFEHFRRYPWVLEPYHYTDQESLIATLDENVIRPAETKANELLPGQGR